MERSTKKYFFSNITRDIHFLADYLHEHQVKKVAMESADIDWIPIWNVLETSRFAE